MGDVAIFIVMLMYFVLGVFVGHKIGHELGTRATTARQYWLYNLAVVLVGILVSAVVSLLGLRSTAGMAIGMIAGAIVGLKFGYGKSVGIWARHDRAFRVNADQLDEARADEEARERGEDPAQARERELISVGRKDDAGAGEGGSRRRGR